MALTLRNPNTIMLTDKSTYARVGSHDLSAIIGYRAGAAITPGMLVERYSVSNELKWRANASATELAAHSVALDKPDEVNNTGIDDAYAANENVEVAYVWPGAVFYGKVVSGQTVADGALLQSNGNGWLKAATATTQAAGLGWMQSLDNLGTIAADTRCRVLVIA